MSKSDLPSSMDSTLFIIEIARTDNNLRYLGTRTASDIHYTIFGGDLGRNYLHVWMEGLRETLWTPLEAPSPPFAGVCQEGPPSPFAGTYNPYALFSTFGIFRGLLKMSLGPIYTSIAPYSFLWVSQREECYFCQVVLLGDSFEEGLFGFF